MSRRGLLKFGASAGMVAAAAPLLAACQTTGPATSAGPTLPPGPKTLIWGAGAGFDRLDPHYSTQSVDNWVFDAVMESLTFVNPDGSMNKSFGLATDWRSVDDKRWQFKLRQGVKFHNGDPFTAADVKYSLERGVDPKRRTLTSGALAPITGVEIVDDFTVNIVTSAVDPLLLKRLSAYGSYILPSKYHQAIGDSGFETKMVGTGPFRMVSAQRDGAIVVDANKGYWAGAPAVDRIEWRAITDDTARVTALLHTNEINLSDEIPTEQLGQVRSDPNVKVIQFDRQTLLMMQINLRAAPLNNKLVRQALSLAIDRASLNKNLLGGQYRIANGFIPKNDFGYEPNLPPLPFDPAKAKDLLKQAGYQGEPIVIENGPGVVMKVEPAISLAAIQMWKDVGINARLDVIENAVRVEKRAKRDFKGLVWAGVTSSQIRDPDYIMWRSLGVRDLFGWENAEFLRLGKESAVSLDQNLRLKNFQRMNAIAIDEVPSILLFQDLGVFSMKKYVEFTPPAGTVMDFRKENLRFVG